ncbi:MAG: aspartate-semialdehyde dehydrogenase [Coriobacteriia bacterium]|nr:aspartate-semialdehyde dehydrogenase [Coriobacteriia bacterium]
MNVAVVGATGAVGEEMLKVLEERNFPATKVTALASERSAGKKLPYSGPGSDGTGFITVEELTHDSFDDVDIALFSAGASISEEYGPSAVKAGTVIVDNSSAFRMQDDVPLVVPEVNPQDVATHQGIIANPNCSTIPMAMALHAMSKVAPIKRVVVSTYQAASGAGAAAMDELYDQTGDFLAGRELEPENFAHRIAFNCIPHIDVFLDDGSTKEEWKMVVETRKILHDPDLAVSATCVRVPVLRCHSESINVEFDEPITLEAIREALEATDGITLMDEPDNKVYPMPAFIEGTDGMFIGRLRIDDSVPHGIAFWNVSDQLRKGAALNTVQIAELLV